MNSADLQQCLVAVLRCRGPREALALYDELVEAGTAPDNLTPWPEIREVLAAPDERARELIFMRLNVYVREAVELALSFNAQESAGAGPGAGAGWPSVARAEVRSKHAVRR